MPSFILPPADTSWLDRAQSREGRFDPAMGFVLLELDGEHYAVSGRYMGIPQDDEAVAMVVSLHCERGMVELSEDDRASAEAGEEIPWLAEQVKILCRFPGTSIRQGERNPYTLRRYTLQTAAEDGTGPGTFARP